MTDVRTTVDSPKLVPDSTSENVEVEVHVTNGITVMGDLQDVQTSSFSDEAEAANLAVDILWTSLKQLSE